jgi:hypothetical protein
MMANQTWPSATYIRRIFVVYLIAAGAAGFLTLVALIVIYAPKSGLLFLAGIITGALAGYAVRAGSIHRVCARALDVIRHPHAILPY